MRSRSLAALALLVLVTATAAWAQHAPAAVPPSDEIVVLYPSFLARDPGLGMWRGEVRGAVYEPGGGVGARLARACLRATLSVMSDPTPEEQATCRERARLFAVDHERGQKIVVTIGDRSFVSSGTLPNGRFVADVTLDDGAAGSVRPFTVRLQDGTGEEVAGVLHLVGPEGVSVISDVDDTVKDSHVLDRGELVANTFYRPYRAIPGMADLYRGWGEQGVAVHYVTGSPWQLFLPLWGFLSESRFPGVDLQMRPLRWADPRSLVLFRDPRTYKKSRIREILERFPGRQFVLVGDSGEHDPEVYAAAAREWPDRVQGIFIRAVTDEHRDPARYRGLFDGVEESKWVVFHDPSVLPPDLAAWLGSRGHGQGTVADPPGPHEPTDEDREPVGRRP